MSPTGRDVPGDFVRISYWFKISVTILHKRIGFFTLAATSLLWSNGARGQQFAPPAPAAVGGSTSAIVQPRFLLDRAAASQFDSAFDNIAERAHVFIVTEGTPLRQTLTAEQMQAQFGEQSGDANQPLQDLTAKLADAYDYDSEQVDARTFVLRKRYSDPEDLPCVTYAEILSGLKAVLQVIDAYSPTATRGEDFADQKLYDTLSPEQKGHAVAGLTLADLDPGQRQLACEALDQAVLEFRVSALRRVVALISTAKLRGTTFQWVTLPLPDGTPVKAFGYQGRFGRFGGVEPRPLTAPFKSIGDGYCDLFLILPKDSTGHSIPRPLRFTDVGGKKVQMVDITETFAEDPTIPSEQDKSIAPDGMLWRRSAHTLTLLEAANRLEPLPAAGAPTHPEVAAKSKATVESAIADKVVNVFGQLYQGDERHYVKTLCDVYGLQLREGEHMTYTIEAPRPRATETPADVPAEIRRVTPLPLIRALTGQTEHRFSVMQDRKLHDPAFTPGEGIGRDDRALAARSVFDAENAYYFPAARRLIALAEPAVPTPASPPVPVNAVGPEALRLIAIAAASGNCMTLLRYLQHYVPPECLVHPETLLIKMTQVQKDGMSILTAVYGTRRANGTFKYQAETHSSRKLQPESAPLVSPDP